MAKEWILNSVMNRFQLNFKRNVGATSESIRACAPSSLEEWRDYYFKYVKSVEHIESLGRKLYVKITEVIQSEVAEITEKDCIDYMKQLVIDRTFDGYMSEIQTVYGILQNNLGVPVQPAPDEWDRLFNVDFFVKVGEKYIGLQIKPVNTEIQLAEIHKEYSLQAKTHQRFTDRYGGKVFYVFSQTVNGKKEITNKDVIRKIAEEVKRLQAY
jgi:hypothetical protein